MVDDHKLDSENHYGNHQDSETSRKELHVHITTVATKVVEDNTRHTTHQEELQEHIIELNQRLEAEK